MSSPDIPGLVQRLRKTYKANKTRPLEWRKQQLRQIEKMFKENESQFRESLKKDLGHKTRFFAEAIELSQIYEEINVSLENLDQWVKPDAQSTPIVMQPGSSFVLPEPLGMVLIISPWNYPLSLLICPLIGAISAGNCVVMKPSEVAPANSNLLAKLVPQYLDKDAVAVVEGAVEETTELLRQKWDYIFYTGNGTVAKIILRAAAENLTPCTLELGGKSPCVVDSSANLDVAANRILWGKYINVGQTCVAPDYLLVDKSIEKPLLEKLKQGLKKFYGENPQKSEDYSRIVNQRHANRLNTLLERAKKENVEIFTGGTVDVDDCYIAPTIIRNVKKDSALMEDEIFGPLLPVLTFDSMEEAISFINSREKPLAAYLYSNDKKNQDSFLQYVTSGGGCINDNVIQVGNNNLPFGGVGPSGMGAYHGKHSFHLFSHHKAIIAKKAGLDLDLRYPPYTETKLNRLALVRSVHIPRQAIVATATAGIAAIGYAVLQVPLVKEILVVGLKTALDVLQ